MSLDVIVTEFDAPEAAESRCAVVNNEVRIPLNAVFYCAVVF